MRFIRRGEGSREKLYSSRQREFVESKVDMGLIDPFSKDALDCSLYAAVIEGDDRNVPELSRRGADPDLLIAGVGSTVSERILHYAARSGSLTMVLALLQVGADPLLQNSDGQTPRQLLPPGRVANQIRAVLKSFEKPDVVIWETCVEEDEIRIRRSAS